VSIKKGELTEIGPIKGHSSRIVLSAAENSKPHA